MSTSKIPYLTHTWPITSGCRPDFPCWTRCWARGLAHRFNAIGTPAGDFEPKFHEEWLQAPLHWRKPRVVGVSFYGDLFVDGITDEQIEMVFGVMAVCPSHRFLVLTKRAERMAQWFTHRIERPMPHVYLGVSVATQEDADARIPHLLRCGGANKWVSVEPCLERISLTKDVRPLHNDGRPLWHRSWPMVHMLDWVVVAGETGPQARPLHLDHVRLLRDQCAAEKVPFMFKDRTSFPRLDGVVHYATPWVRA